MRERTLGHDRTAGLNDLRFRCRSKASRTALVFAVLASTLVSASACRDEPAAPDPPLQGGILVTFQVSGEEFRVWVTNRQTIGQIFAVLDGLNRASIPNGAIHAGPGRQDHNAPWSWHLDPEDIQMAEATIEVCDGRPSLVEASLGEYLAQGRFCPWGASLVNILDRR
jgi:hypothetical protein